MHFAAEFPTDCAKWVKTATLCLMNSRGNGEELVPGPVDVDSLTAEERLKLGPVIRQLRETKGLDAQDLARAASVDRKTLRTIETGERAGQPAKLHAILEALGVPQVGDYDRFDERVRSFIYTTAPIFDQLPDELKTDAQNDVVALLAGKLARAADIPVIGGHGGPSSVRSRHQDRKVAFEFSEDRGEEE